MPRKALPARRPVTFDEHVDEVLALVADTARPRTVRHLQSVPQPRTAGLAREGTRTPSPFRPER